MGQDAGAAHDHGPAGAQAVKNACNAGDGLGRAIDLLVRAGIAVVQTIDESHWFLFALFYLIKAIL